MDKLVESVKQAQIIWSTRRRHKAWQFLSRRGGIMTSAPMQTYYFFSLFRWAGLIGGIVWALAMAWALCVPLERVWKWLLVTWFSKAEGIWLVSFVLLSSSVAWGILGMQLGCQFIRRHVRLMLNQPMGLEGGWRARMKLVLPAMLEHLSPANPLVLIAATNLLLGWVLLSLLKKPPRDWLPATWTAYVTFMYLVISWPTTHLLTGYLVGWFRYSNWVGCLKERQSLRHLGVPQPIKP